MSGKTKTIIIVEHETGASQIIYDVPEEHPSHLLVEAWQKLRPKPRGVTWKIAESNSISSVLVECARLKRSVPKS